MRSPTRALTRFHLRSGARVALRANAALLGIVTFIFGSAPAPDALLTFVRFMLGIVSRTATSGPRMLLAAIAAGLGASAVPRVLLGTSGWIRSLPVDAQMRRRAAVAAVTAAQAIIAIAVVVFVVVIRFVVHAPLDWSRIVGVPVMMVAISGAMLPRQRLLIRLFDMLAVAAAVNGTWATVLVAIALVAVSNALPVADVAVAPRAARQYRDLASRRVRSPRELWMRSAWIAIGARGFVDAAFVTAVPSAFAYFIARNNPNLPVGTVHRVAVVCTAIGIVVFGAGLTNALLAGRQPWPWARSLPWSAMDRVVSDALVLGAPLLVVVAVIAPLHLMGALAMLSFVPFTAAVCSGVLRGAATKQFGAAGRSLVIAMPVGIMIAMWPVLGIAALAATPLVLRWGASRERDTRATRWAELQHSAAGDPLWITRA